MKKTDLNACENCSGQSAGGRCEAINCPGCYQCNPGNYCCPSAEELAKKKRKSKKKGK